MFKFKIKSKFLIKVGEIVDLSSSSRGWVPYIITKIESNSGKVYGRMTGSIIDHNEYLFDLSKLEEYTKSNLLRLNNKTKYADKDI